MRFSRGAVLLLVATSSACILFGVDDLTGGGSGSDSGSDAIDDTSTIDATADSTAPTDAGADSAPAFDCKSIDATFCDSFDRDAAVTIGAPWKSASAYHGCTITVDGAFTSTMDASSGQPNCYLTSNPVTGETGHFMLDFDLSYTTDTSSSIGVLLAQVAVSFPGSIDPDSGVQLQNFQLLLEGIGTGRTGMFDYFPDAAASPQPGNQYVAYEFASATPFLRPSPPCHITWDIDAITPTSTATATCGAIISATLPEIKPKPRPGFAGAATLYFGFANPSTVLPAWSITYDNMVFQASP